MRCLLTLIAVGVFVPAGVKAQSSVIMKATVSEIVVLSASPASAPSNTVSLVLSGDDQVVRVPLLIRSNTSFKISATFESKTAVLSELSVDNVRPTGTLVSPQIVSALHLNPQLDPDTSQPLLVLSGPRISLGGTLNSPNNAMEVTLLIRLTPPAGRWTAQLSLVATKQL
jgi:hypothetical protein